MHTTKYIKQSISILSLATLLAGCGGGSSATSTEATVSTTTPAQVTTAPATAPATTTTAPATAATTTAVAKAVQSGQVKDSSTGTGLANVKVSLGESTTTTDENGFYTLSDLTTSEEVIVNFDKEGYFLGSTKIQIKTLSGDNTLSSNYIEYTLDGYDDQSSYDSQTETSTSHTYIPAAVYTDTSGSTYGGQVTTELKTLDVTTDEGKELFPGSFEGEDSNGENVKFNSYGLISILPKDSDGNTLEFTDGASAVIAFDPVASLNEQTVPLWYYDYDQGKWIEDGYAERQEGGWYQGEISHPGTWSLSKPIDDAPGIYRGRIVYEDGTPAEDIRVYAVGDEWKSTDLSTDEDGFFEIEVVPGNSFQLKAYNYKDKYGVTYNSMISAIASGEIVEN